MARKLIIEEFSVNAEKRISFKLTDRILAVTVFNKDTSAVNAKVAWNADAGVRTILPGYSVGYGGYEGHYLDDNTLFIEFEDTAGIKGVLVTIEKAGPEIC